MYVSSNPYSDNENEIHEKLRQIALNDDHMTADEAMIISRAMINYQKFKKMLIEAVEDGMISDEEKQGIEAVRHRIYDDAFDIALKDEAITHEEADLLRVILKITKSLSDQ